MARCKRRAFLGLFDFVVYTLNVPTYIRGVNLESHLHQAHFQSEHNRLHFHILVVARQLELVGRRVLKIHGISPAQYNVLRILRGQKGQPIAVQSLAERMIDPSSNASRIIDKLEQKGWAQRSISPHDRRKSDVQILPAGLQLLSGLDEPMSSMFSRCLSDLDSDAAQDLNNKLALVLNATDDLIQEQ